MENLKNLFKEHNMDVAVVVRKDRIDIQVPGDMLQAAEILRSVGISKFKTCGGVIIIEML